MFVLRWSDDSRRRRLVVALGALLAGLVLLVGGWVAWSFLRPPPDGFAPTAGQADEVPLSPGVSQYTVDARNRSDWAYFDFSSGSTVGTSPNAADWDIAFRRTDVLTNSGETNPQGDGGALDLGEVPFEEAGAPADGYATDRTDDERGLENPALHKWYGYNWTTHIVSSKGHTYAVRTADGERVALTFLSYYCDDGSAGCVTFQYRYPAEARAGR